MASWTVGRRLFVKQSRLLSFSLRDVRHPRLEPEEFNLVSDNVDLLHWTERLKLSATLREVKSATGVECAICVVPSVPFYMTNHYFGTRVFNRWGLGHPTRHDGLLILLITGSRKLQLIWGPGVDKLISRKRLLGWKHKSIDPLVGSGDLVQGLEAASEALRSSFVSAMPISPIRAFLRGIAATRRGEFGGGHTESSVKRAGVYLLYAIAGGGLAATITLSDVTRPGTVLPPLKK